MSDTTTAAERLAHDIGRAQGWAAGSWVSDGNTSTATLRAIVDASEAGEFFGVIVPDMSGPLSGEYAGSYSIRDLSDDTGVDEGSDDFADLCTAYEDAYFVAFEDEAVRSARASLPEGA
jgi:hypothetical protein